MFHGFPIDNRVLELLQYRFVNLIALRRSLVDFRFPFRGPSDTYKVLYRTRR